MKLLQYQGKKIRVNQEYEGRCIYARDGIFKKSNGKPKYVPGYLGLNIDTGHGGQPRKFQEDEISSIDILE